MSRYLVSAIVSTYEAERFMRGCLLDLEQQTIASELEIVIIDSASPQAEGSIVAEFKRRYDNIVYVRTAKREGLYESWNRAVAIANGKFLTNANADDRHRPDAFERLVQRLESHASIGLAYGDQLISRIENETFAACAIRGASVRRWSDFTPERLMLSCIVGSQPMWRADLHAEHGLFSRNYRIAGDYEFWMRIAQTCTLSHLDEPLGVLYESPNTLYSANQWQCEMESLEIRKQYLHCEPWRRDRTLPTKVARELFGIGYRYVAQRHPHRALPFLEQAWRLDKKNVRFLKTLMYRGWLGGLAATLLSRA